MTLSRPVGSTRWLSKSGIGYTEGPEFFRCVDIRQPQMHEILCFDSDRITPAVHPTTKVDVGAGVVGQFSSNYLTENRRRIPILGQIPINGSVKLLVIPEFHRTSGPMYTENILDPYYTTGWGDGGTSNHKWPVFWGGPYSNVSILWCSAVLPCPACMSRSLDNMRAAERRVCDDFLCGRRRSRMTITSASCNPVQNSRINRRGDDWVGPVDP